MSALFTHMRLVLKFNSDNQKKEDTHTFVVSRSYRIRLVVDLIGMKFITKNPAEL